MLYSVLYLFIAAQQMLSLFVASLHMLLYEITVCRFDISERELAQCLNFTIK